MMLGITEVIENLYISGLESQTAILNKGIRSVINISSECPVQDLGPMIDYEKINIQDLPTTSIQPYFDRLADRIDKNLQQGIKTLVHCYVGRSRSASVILAYLMKYKQMSLREAFYYLRSRRPIIGPNFGFIKQVIIIKFKEI
jgi:protein-tyrosine phosphatase